MYEADIVRSSLQLEAESEAEKLSTLIRAD